MEAVKLTFFVALTLPFAGCMSGQEKPTDEQKPVTAAGEQKTLTPAGDQKPFMDAKKMIPARLEWNKDLTAKKEGTIRYRVTTSDGPFNVLFVTDSCWQAIQANNKAMMKKEGMLHQATSKGTEKVLEGTLKVPAGKSWIIVENRTEKPAEIHIQLYSQ